MQSLSNRSQHRNSLLTGKFTGNFAKSEQGILIFLNFAATAPDFKAANPITNPMTNPLSSLTSEMAAVVAAETAVAVRLRSSAPVQWPCQVAIVEETERLGATVFRGRAPAMLVSKLANIVARVLPWFRREHPCNPLESDFL
jgi:hypothetical protein